MKNIFIIGDYIRDQYVFGAATRLCPEGPVPVIVPYEFRETDGGAGLVMQQLRALGFANNEAWMWYGSESIKLRVFADDHLMTRLDFDSIKVSNPHQYEKEIVGVLKKTNVGLLIISDYSKGALTQWSAGRIMQAAKILDIPVLVDAKHHWSWYHGALAMFPNEKEMMPNTKVCTWTVRKLGKRGCEVNGLIIPTNERTVRDTTGAGDVFLAGFAYKLLPRLQVCGAGNLTIDDITECATFGNLIAGKSVESVGTKIVSLHELEGE